MEKKLKIKWNIECTYLLIIIVASLIPRLLLLLNAHSYSSDGVSYLSTALYLREPSLVGEVPKRIYFILFPSLVLLFDIVIHNPAMSGRIISFLVGMAIPPLVFFLGKRIFGRYPSFIGALFCGINPILVWQSAEIRGDNLFAFLTIFSILIFEKSNWTKPRIQDAVYLAVIMGLAQLTRTNGVMYLLVIIPLWLRKIRKQEIPAGSWVLRTLIPFLIVFAVVSSIPHLLLVVRGEERPSMFVYTYLDGNIASLGDRENIFFRLNADASEYQFLEDVADADFRTVIETLPQLPQKYFHNLNYCFTLFFGPAIEIMLKLSILLIPLLFYILYYGGEMKAPAGALRLLFWFWPSFFILPAINVEDLYFLPFVPLLMLFMAWLIVTVSSLGWISRWRIFVLLILIHIIAVPMFQQTSREIKEEAAYKNPYVQAGEWIERNTPESTLIMARNPEIFFHALRRGFRMPSEDLNRTLIFALNRNIEYMIFGPMEMNKREDLFWEAYNEVYRLGVKSRLSVAKTIETDTDIVYVLKIVPENFKVRALPKIE